MKNLVYKIRSYFRNLKWVSGSSASINNSSQYLGNAYFFTHVPKTGGTSLIATLDRFFPATSIFPHQLWWEVNDLERVRAQGYSFFRGHFGGGACDLLTDKEIHFFTVLRNPINLAYSTYQHVLRDKETQVHEFVIKNNLSFDQFLSHPKTSHLASNRIVHNLCYGEDNQIEKNGTIIDEKSFKKLRKQLNPIHNGLTEEECFQKAIEFIDKAKWFGILEHFNESLDLLSYNMIWPPIGQTAKLNRNKKPSEISTDAKQQARKINDYDFQLYEYSLNSFRNKYKNMLKELGAAPNANKQDVSELIDLHYQKNYLKTNNTKLKNNVSFTVGEAILGSQWHQREWSINHQSYFCWSGPGNDSFIDFWMIPDTYELKIKIINIVNKAFLSTLVISINDQVVNSKVRKKGSTQELILSCKKRMIKSNGLLRIQFSSHTAKLKPGILQSEDDREVGFALSTVTIK